MLVCFDHLITFMWSDVFYSTVYAIEATVHAPTWEGVYGEIFKVLKPGGVVGRFERCTFMSRIEISSSLVSMNGP